jgi:hypothetical protein
LGLQLSHTLVRVLRGLAWLGGDREARSAFGLVEVIEKSIGRELVGVRRVLDDSESSDWTKFSQLHADVRALRETADGLS